MSIKTTQRPEHRATLKQSSIKFANFWKDSYGAVSPTPSLTSPIDTDLLIVGGGYFGLWSSIIAKTAAPEMKVVLCEAGAIGDGASGKNGGFLQYSLTHGIEQGIDRFKDELTELEELGRENFSEIVQFIQKNDLDIDFEETGAIEIAKRRDPNLSLRAVTLNENGTEASYLTSQEVQDHIKIDGYVDGILTPKYSAVLDPFKFTQELKRIALNLGVEIFEYSPVLEVQDDDSYLTITTPLAKVTAKRAIVATNVNTELIPSLRRYIAPVYDYALMTEPLTSEQFKSTNWSGREGLSDIANQFHYFRLTADNRILWGGYDAIYHFRNAISRDFEVRSATFERLLHNFYRAFPYLEELTFTHGWGGAIDTCTRFTPFFGTSHSGKVSYASGFTGLGVAATRFSAKVAFAIHFDRDWSVLHSRYVSEKPLPMPPEPIRYLAIEKTKRSLAKEDQTGRADLWLKATRRLKFGFAS
ncbi:MAG: FAD-dependent oxidoreductase [Actinomycetota bacterium]|nr:FAD-dependent oxidoreductase [Actinomycetota bacterium]